MLIEVHLENKQKGVDKKALLTISAFITVKFLIFVHCIVKQK